MKRFDLRSQQSIAWGLLILIMVVYTLDMSHQAILRYDTFKATAFDLGNMDQVLWNTIHGRLFQFTNQAIDWYGPPTRLALHFEPIILPLSLLYAFGADPRILLVFQTIVLALGAVPVFLLTRKYLPEWPLLSWERIYSISIPLAWRRPCCSTRCLLSRTSAMDGSWSPVSWPPRAKRMCRSTSPCSAY